MLSKMWWVDHQAHQSISVLYLKSWVLIMFVLSLLPLQAEAVNRSIKTQCFKNQTFIYNEPNKIGILKILIQKHIYILCIVWIVGYILCLNNKKKRGTLTMMRSLKRLIEENCRINLLSIMTTFFYLTDGDCT